VDPKLYALATAVCFGLNPITLKIGFERGGRPDSGMVVGLIVAFPVFLLFLPLTGGAHLDQVTLPALAGFVAGGLFGSGVGRRWLYHAIARLGASPATAIKNSAPVVSVLLAAILFAEPVSLLQWFAIVAIVGGVVIVTWKPGQPVRSWVDIGVLFALGAALTYGVRPIFLEYGLSHANLPLTSALIGAAAALTYGLVFGDRSELKGITREAAFWWFVISGIIQALGFLAFNFGLSGGQVTVVYPVTASAPLFTVAFTAIFLRGQERLTWRIVLGAAAVVAGVIVL
jgi:drug/metabolite transporter (DMT)-like permease